MQANLFGAIPADYQREFLEISVAGKEQTIIDNFLENVDRLSRAYTFHGNSFKTEEEEEAFLALAGLKGSVTFVNPYGTRGKDFKLLKFDMGQFDAVIKNDIVKNALIDYFKANPQLLDDIAQLVAEDEQELIEIRNLLSGDLNTGLYMVLKLLVDRFDNDRDIISRKGREDKIIKFFGMMEQAIGTNVANPINKNFFISQIKSALQNFRIERSHGYQVFEVGISLSERITMQLFGRGGRQKAPRSEQTLISLDIDQTQIAAKGFEGLGTNEGQRKFRAYLSQVDNLNQVKEELRDALKQMGIEQSRIDSVLTEMLTFNRREQLEATLNDLSMQVLSVLISDGVNERAAQDATAKFIAKLKNNSLESLQKESFIKEAEKFGLTKSHIDRIIDIRFKETSASASTGIRNAVLFDRAKDYFRTKLSKSEQALPEEAKNFLTAQRARTFIETLKSRNDFKTEDEYNVYLQTVLQQYEGLENDFFQIDKQGVESVIILLQSYTEIEQVLAGLFREAQYALDVIDSQRRVNKSEFDSIEYEKANELAEIKGAIENGTYETEDGTKFSVKVNEQIIEIIFEKYERTKDFKQLQKDLRTLGMVVPAEAEEYVGELKNHYLSLIKQEKLDLIHQGALDDAFRGANAKLLKKFSELNQKNSRRLQERIQELKKNGIKRREFFKRLPSQRLAKRVGIEVDDVQSLVDIAFDTYEKNKDNPDVEAYAQLQKDLAALKDIAEIGIEITSDDPAHIAQKRKEINKAVKKGDISFDYLVFGGVLGQEFLAASPQLYEQAQKIRESYQNLIKEVREAILKEFADEIQNEFDAFIENLHIDYAEAILQSKSDILSEVQRTEGVDTQTIDRNTSKTVDDAIDLPLAKYKMRIAEQTDTTNATARALAKLADKVISWTLKNIFRKVKDTDALVTKQKAADVTLPSAERKVLTEEVPAAVFPVQVVNVNKEQRSIEDKKAVVEVVEEISVKDGKLLFNSPKETEEAQEEVTARVTGNILGYETVDGKKTMKLEIDSLDQAGDAMVIALKAYSSAGRAGSIDIDNIELVIGGKQVAKLNLSRAVLFQIMNKNRAGQLNDLLQNGGMMEVNGELIIFGKNSQGVMQAHNIGAVEDVHPDVTAIFEIKKLSQKVSFFQLAQMSQEEKSKFFAENPIARHPLFIQVLTQDVKVEDGVILVGNNNYTKGNVGKGTVLVNAQLGKNVKVGENSFIMDSEIGTLGEADSSIGNNVEIKNAKIASSITAGKGTKIESVIANELITGEQALLERVNSAKYKIVVGDRSALLDFEGQGFLTMLDDQFKQGNEETASYGSSKMDAIIIRETGAVIKGLKFLQRKFGEWAMNFQKENPKSRSTFTAVRVISDLTFNLLPRKFLAGVFGYLYNLIGQKILPEGRQWAALQNERSKYDEEIKERFKEQRQRLQTDLKTPFDLLFALDARSNFSSDVINELQNISQIKDEAERKAKFDAYLIKMFGEQPQQVRDKLSLFFEDVIKTAQTENKDISDVFQDKIFDRNDQIKEQLDSIDSLDKLAEFEAFAKLFRMYYPDIILSLSLARDVAVRGYELADTAEKKNAYLIKALNFNKVLIDIDPADQKSIDMENDFLSKLNINPEFIAQSLQEKLSKMHSAIVAHLMENENIDEQNAKSIADNLLLLIDLSSDLLPFNIAPAILQRQILRLAKQNKDKFPLLLNVGISAQGEFNAGIDNVDFQTLRDILLKFNIDLQDLIDSLNLGDMDTSAKWVSQQDVWEMNLIRGKELYKDSFFDNIRSVLKNFPVQTRNIITRILLDSYSKTSSSVNLLSDLKRQAMDIEKAIDGGKYSGKVLQNKLQTAITLLKIGAMIQPYDYEILASLSIMMGKMSEIAVLADINNLTKDELVDALISARVVNSRQDALDKADAVIKQRAQAPIDSIDDIFVEGWGVVELERLRNANIAGAKESSDYYKSSAMQINERALALAKEADDKYLITVLSMRQAEYLFDQSYVQPDKIQELLDGLKDRISVLKDKDLRNELQAKYDFFNLKVLVEQKKNSKEESDKSELIKAFDKFKKSNPYYVDVLMMKAQFMEQLDDIEAADAIYSQIIKSFPEHADAAELKRLELALKQSDNIDFMTQSRPISPEDEQQAVFVLKRLQDAVKNKSISDNPQFIENIFSELLSWQLSAEENSLSDEFVSEVLQTIALLNVFVSDLIAQNISDQHKASSVNTLMQLQDQVNSTLFDFHSVSGNSLLEGIVEIALDVSWVDMEGKIKAQAPVVAIVRDNMDMDQIDHSGFLGNELNKLKMDSLIQFVQLINPAAKVSLIGDHIVVTGLTDLQLALFNNMFTYGQEKALEMMETSIARRIGGLFKDKKLSTDQIASSLAEEFGINITDAKEIAGWRDSEKSEIKENLHIKILNLLKLDTMAQEQRTKLNELFVSDIQSSIESLINQKIESLKAEGAGEEQLKPFEDILETVTSKSIFNADNYRLVIGKAAVPAYYAPLVELLNQKDVAAYKIKIGVLIENTQNEIGVLESKLSELSAVQLAHLARLKERLKEFKILENVKDLETFNNIIKNRTNLVQDIFAEALLDFDAQEKNERKRLETKPAENVELTTPEALKNPSKLSNWLHLWNSITDKQFKNEFYNEYKKAVQAKDTFQYLLKVLQGASPAELAPLRAKMTANLQAYLGPQLGAQMAPVIVQMIEQNKGNVEQTLAVFQQFCPQLVNQVKGFFVKDVSQPVTLAAVYELYSDRLKEMSGLTLDRKTQELQMDEENLFTPAQITELRELGVKNPFSLSSSDVALMHDLLGRMDSKKQVIKDWLDENEIGKQEQRQTIAEAVMKIHGVDLGTVSPAQAQKIMRAIPSLNLKLYVDSDNKAYMIPQLDPSNPSDMPFLQKALEYSGIENVEEFLQQASDMVKLPEKQLLFPSRYLSLMDGYKRKIHEMTADEYIEELFGNVEKSAGFMAFRKRDTAAAAMVKEFMDSIKYRRRVNPHLLNLEGIQFITRVFLNQRILTRLMNEDTKRADVEYIKAIRIMFDKTTEIFGILLNDEANTQYKLELTEFLDELTAKFNILNEKFLSFGLEFDGDRKIKDETIDDLQSEFIVLDDLIDKIIRKNAQIQMESSVIDEQTAVEELIRNSDDREIYLMQICLKEMFSNPIVAISDLSDDEKQGIAEKFFSQVKFNKNRLDLFINMLDEIFSSGYLSTGNVDDVQYSRAIESLKTRIRAYERKYSKKEPAQSAFVSDTAIPFGDAAIKSITDNLQAALQDKVKALLEQVGKNITIDIVQNRLKTDPVLERVLNEISTLTGKNVKDILYRDRLKGLFSVLFDQALEASMADKVLFPNTFAFFNEKNIRSADEIRDALIDYMLHIYIDAPMSDQHKALFENAYKNVRDELTAFLERKIPQFNKVRNQETSTDKRVVLSQLFQAKLGNNIFDIGSLPEDSKAVIRGFLFEDIRPYVSRQKQDNQYVFVINFDALTSSGKISVNESNFLLKETMAFLEETAGIKGKDVKFVIVSDKYDSSHVSAQLSALRISEVQVDIFAKDLGTGNKSLSDLIEIIRNNYVVDNENLKFITGPGNIDAQKAAAKEGIQIMEINPDAAFEKTESGEVFAQTLVGALNLIVRGSMDNFESLPLTTKVLSFMTQAPKKAEIEKLTVDFKGSFNKDLFKNPQFMKRLKEIFGINLTDTELQDMFYESLIAYILEQMQKANIINENFNIKLFKEAFDASLIKILGSNALLGELLPKSMFSLVLQPPKQKISNAYLREYEKMKMAEEFA
ncbi:hypothetical protein J7L67_01555 [bacterium]|nr:hypothetical protein [bacterium]